jgi:hypothetical protein
VIPSVCVQHNCEQISSLINPTFCDAYLIQRNHDTIEFCPEAPLTHIILQRTKKEITADV